MRYKIILIAVGLLLLGINSNAKEVTSSEYRELSKRYITEVIYCFMTVYESIEDPIGTTEKVGMIKFKNSYLYNDDWIKSSIDSTLAMGWIITKDGLFKNYYELIATDSISFFDLLEYSDNSIHDLYKEEFYNKLDLIKESYILEIKNLKNIETNSSTQSSSTQKEQLKNTENIKSNNYTQDKMLNFSGVKKWVFYIFLITALFLLGSKYLQQKEKISQLKKEINRLKNDLKWAKTGNLKNNKDNKETEVPLKMISKNNESNSSLNQQPKPIEEINQQPINTDNEQTKPELNIEIEPTFESKQLFFETYENGYFNSRQGKETQGSWDVYKLTTTSENQGNIELLTQNTEELISNRDVYLLNGICDVTYQTGGLRNKFQETGAGKVRKEGDKWLVEQKIKVVII